MVLVLKVQNREYSRIPGSTPGTFGRIRTYDLLIRSQTGVLFFLPSKTSRYSSQFLDLFQFIYKFSIA
jgi:hypothetical protein